jgi:hypothetical protein
MPRGVYKRNSATAKKVVALKQVNEPKQDAAMVAPEFLVKPEFYNNKRVSVDRLAGQPLQAYAQFIGISKRDIDNLSEDRLRQNCKALIYARAEEA